MRERLIQVLYVKPHERPEELIIENDLSHLQNLVDGYIEVICLEDGAIIICNEEGKIRGLPANRGLFDLDNNLVDIIRGPFLIAYAPFGSEEFLSLPHNLIKKYKQKFAKPEYWVNSSKN